MAEGFIGLSKQQGSSKGPAGKEIDAAATNSSGTVAAKPEQNAALFLSPVDIGGQTVNLDFDSGSSDL